MLLLTFTDFIFILIFYLVITQLNDQLQLHHVSKNIMDKNIPIYIVKHLKHRVVAIGRFHMYTFG